MNIPNLKFLLLDEKAVLPTYAHDGDAGFDLFSIEKIKLAPRETKLIHFGLAAEIPQDYFVSFRDKSGLASKFGLHVLGGVIDSGYRGEWIAIMINLGKDDYTFQVGDKVAQAILQPAPQAEISKVTKFVEITTRGKGGFGSTGKK